MKARTLLKSRSLPLKRETIKTHIAKQNADQKIISTGIETKHLYLFKEKQI